MPRFRPRDLRHATLEELRRQLNEIQREISSDIDLLARRSRVTELQLGDYAAAFGDVVRMAPPAAGARLILPEPLPSRVGDPAARVTLTVEAAVGAVTVEVVSGTINGATTLAYPLGVFAAEFVLTPEGWFTADEANDAPADAEYVLGAADADLPNGRVATDSTEIDADLTVANVISWALNTASVAFSKLANLAGLSVLGRSASSSGVMAAITASAARQVPRVVDAGTSIAWGFPIEAQQNDVDLGDVHTVNAEGALTATVSSGILTLFAGGKDIDVTIGGANDPYLLPSTFVSGDRLRITLSSNATITRIFDSAGNALPDNTTLILSLFDAGGASTFSLQLIDTSASNAGRIRTPGGPASAAVNENYVMASHEEGAYLVTGASSGGVSTWRVVAGTAAQAITGAVAVAAGDGGSRASTFSGIQDNNSAETAQTNLNFVSGTSVTLAVAQDAGNNRMNVTAARAALTGFATATADSNATSSAEPIVTYSSSGNMSAERVLSDGQGTVVDIATAGQIKLNLSTQTNGGAVICHRVTFAATGATGTAIDVTVWNANAPFLLRLLNAQLRVSTAVGGTTAALRTATAGGGAVILPDAAAGTQTFSTAATGLKQDNAVATETVAANGTVILRIDRAIAGELLLFYRA